MRPASTPAASRPLRWLAALRGPMLLLLALAGAVAGPATESAPLAQEHQLKAAFLYNFTKFVDWPPRRFARPESPLVIAVLGKNPFADAVLELARDRRVNGRPVHFRRVEAPEEAREAHLVFIAAGEEARFGPALAALHAAGVLTVGESPRFAAAGGVITFVMQEDKVRFVINLAAAQAAQLRVSAQLQKLASRVERGPLALP